MKNLKYILAVLGFILVPTAVLAISNSGQLAPGAAAGYLLQSDGFINSWVPPGSLSAGTTTATCTGAVSCTPFTIFGSTPVAINGTGGGGSSVSATTTTITQVAHGFLVGQWVGLATSTYALTNAVPGGVYQAVGVVKTVIDADHFILQQGGDFSDVNLVPGMTYFLSASTTAQGTIVGYPPTTIGWIAAPVAFAKSGTLATINYGPTAVVTLSAATFGINVGNDNTGNVYMSTSTMIADAAVVKKNISGQRVRIALPSYNNYIGIYNMRQYALYYKSLGFYVSYGVTGRTGGQTAITYAAWLAQVPTEAAWAAANGIDMFYIGNEECLSAQGGGFGAITYGTCQNNVRTLSSSIKSSYPTMRVVYSDGEGMITQWGSLYPDFGALDGLGFNMYNTLVGFDAGVAFFQSQIGSKFFVSVWAAHGPYFDLSHATGGIPAGEKETDAQYAADLASRQQTLSKYGEEAYFFTLRYGGNTPISGNWNIYTDQNVFLPGAAAAFGGSAGNAVKPTPIQLSDNVKEYLNTVKTAALFADSTNVSLTVPQFGALLVSSREVITANRSGFGTLSIENADTGGYSSLDFLKSDGSSSGGCGYGNSTVGGVKQSASWCGTNSSGIPFFLYTADIPRLMIRGAAVGIGTTTPAPNFAFSVQGSELVSGDIFAANITATGTVTTGALVIPSLTDGCGTFIGGQISSTGSPCGAGGGGGSAGGTWSTTTSSVPGTLINYSNNATDVVAVGGFSTTTAKFWVDPNTGTVYTFSKIGVGTSSPYRAIAIMGSGVVADNFSASSLSATSTATSTIGRLYGVYDYAALATSSDPGNTITTIYNMAKDKLVVIRLPSGTLTYNVLINLGTDGKRALLLGNPGGATTLKWTGTATSTVLNYGDQNTGIDHTSGCGMRDITLQGTSLATSSPQIGLEVGGSFGTSCTVLDNVNIQGFGYGLWTSANNYHFVAQNGTIRGNGQDVHLAPANNSGEGLLFINMFIIDGFATYGQEPRNCFFADNFSSPSLGFIGGSMDDCQLSTGFAVNVTAVNWHMENPGYTAWGKYTFITQTNSFNSSFTMTGGVLMNDATAASGLTPDFFIQTGGTVSLDGVQLFKNSDSSVTNLLNKLGTGVISWRGLNNTGGGVTNIIPGIAFTTDGTTGRTVLGAAPSNTLGQGALEITDGSSNERAFEFRLDSSNDDMQIDRNSGSAWFNFMTWKRSNGFFGLGTTTPSNPFSVQGSGYISSNLFVGGTITSTSTATSTLPNLNATNAIQSGNYYSSDGTVGFTGTCTVLSITSITVKNGLITACN